MQGVLTSRAVYMQVVWVDDAPDVPVLQTVPNRCCELEDLGECGARETFADRTDSLTGMRILSTLR